MAKKTDVTITASGLAGTPIGVSITYQVGAIPTATVQLAPGGAGEAKVSGGTGNFGNIDQKKRQEDITLTVKVKSHNGDQGPKDRSLNFLGLLDGLSVSNMIGQNSYSAVLKNKAQRLLELTTVTPGLYPTSINIYKSSSFSVVKNADDEDDSASTAWGNIRFGLSEEILQKNPMLFWIDMLKHIIQKQQSGWKEFLGADLLVTDKVPFDEIFNDPRYKKSLSAALELMENVNTSAVDGGALEKLSSQPEPIAAALKHIFASGPTVLLENWMTFLSEFGCSLIFGNTKIFVVPVNSVIQQDNEVPGLKQLHKKPNAAHPADYNSYIYNDNGYRDLASVLVTIDKHQGGGYLAGKAFERGNVAHYVGPEDISKGSGVFVVQTNPWMTYAYDSIQPNDSKVGLIKSDQVDQSMHPDIKKYDEVVSQTTEDFEKRDKKRNEDYSDALQDALMNYGETVFYQQRYGDRHGSITMDFNPDWVPGTGGSLYIRESNMFINFYVTSVTHQVETSSPSNGSAITIVNFCCGRMGTNPPGTKEYMFLGYDRGKEKSIQEAFVSDIT